MMRSMNIQDTSLPRQTADLREQRRLEKAATDFEALFISRMLKEAMPEGGGENEIFGKSNARDLYRGMMHEAMAGTMAEGSPFGIRDMLVEEYKRAQNIPAVPNPSSGGIVRDYQVSSPFGLREDPFTGSLRFHSGIDLAATEGSGVFSPVNGTVISAGEVDGYGNCIRVRDREGRTYVFAHLDRIALKAGDLVSRGTKIGTVGSTGRSTGAHLHFEVRDTDNRPVDPETIFTFETGLTNAGRKE